MCRCLCGELSPRGKPRLARMWGPCFSPLFSETKCSETIWRFENSFATMAATTTFSWRWMRHPEAVPMAGNDVEQVRPRMEPDGTGFIGLIQHPGASLTYFRDPVETSTRSSTWLAEAALRGLRWMRAQEEARHGPCARNWGTGLPSGAGLPRWRYYDVG